MQINPEYAAPRAPSLDSFQFQGKERANVRALDGNLSAMSRYIDDFASSLALAQVSAENYRREPEAILFSQWRMMGFKGGILALFNYRKAMDAGMKALKLGPPFIGKLDAKQMEAARDAFRLKFPHTQELRQTLLHNAELYHSEERIAINSITKPQDNDYFTIGGGGLRLMITGGIMDGDIYSINFGGELYSYSLSTGSLTFLIENASSFFKACAALGISASRAGPPQ